MKGTVALTLNMSELVKGKNTPAARNIVYSVGLNRWQLGKYTVDKQVLKYRSLVILLIIKIWSSERLSRPAVVKGEDKSVSENKF